MLFQAKTFFVRTVVELFLVVRCPIVTFVTYKAKKNV
jgi:hypothetical protein